MTRHDARGFSLIELLVVVAVMGLLAAITIPRLMDALDRSRQRATMAVMRDVGNANSLHNVDNGEYAPTLDSLVPDHFPSRPTDAWGTEFRYIRWVFIENSYWLWSYGSDGAVGPFPAAPWVSEPTEGDILMFTGVFNIAPTSQ